MKNVIYIIFYVDIFIWYRVEKFCHWFQKWTGKTNFWLLGKVSLLCCYLMGVGVMAYYAHTTPAWIANTGWKITSKSGVLVPGLILPFYLVEAAWYWKVLERVAFDRLSKRLMNPEKVILWNVCWRLIVGVCCICNFFIGTRSFDLFLFSIWGINLLRCCDPLPPCSAKFKELFKTYKLAPVTEGAN